MNQYSENVKRIAKALMPDPPGTREKQELHEQAGRAIVELSEAENLLAVIFCILSLPVDLEFSKEVFAAQGMFEKKLKLVNFMVLHSNKPQEKKTWGEIFDELNNHRGVRNLIAHQRIFMQRKSDTPEIEVSLTPLFYKNGGKALRTNEIRSTADKLEKINVELWNFIKELDSPR
jgi:hypothetical protein